jgi:mono/diheme cytochrome c family protein
LIEHYRIALLVAACALFTLVACSGAPPSPHAAQSESGAAIFDATCRGCHQGAGPDRPVFAATLDRDVASRALAAILVEDMPPPTSPVRARLSDARRAQLAAWLCAQTGRSDEACTRLQRVEMQPPLTRAGPTMLEIVRRDGASPVADETAKTIVDSTPTNPNGFPTRGRTVRDARLVGVLLVAASQACRLPEGAMLTPEREAARARCIERVLDEVLESPAGARR